MWQISRIISHTLNFCLFCSWFSGDDASWLSEPVLESAAVGFLGGVGGGMNMCLLPSDPRALPIMWAGCRGVAAVPSWRPDSLLCAGLLICCHQRAYVPIYLLVKIAYVAAQRSIPHLLCQGIRHVTWGRVSDIVQQYAMEHVTI